MENKNLIMIAADSRKGDGRLRNAILVACGLKEEKHPGCEDDEDYDEVEDEEYEENEDEDE